MKGNGLKLHQRKLGLDIALKDMVSGHGGDGLMVGLDDLSGLCQP